jgi:hypothetical protein
VIAVHAQENTLTVLRANGEDTTYNPRRQMGVSVYRAQEKVFSIGDRVQFTAPNQELKIANRELGRVENIAQDGTMRLKLDSGRSMEWAQQVHRMSQRRVARLLPIERMTLRYEHHRDRQEALRIRLRELAGRRVRYGYRRLIVLLKARRLGSERETDLPGVHGGELDRADEEAQGESAAAARGAGIGHTADQKWSMDFVAQRLPGGRWIRVLTVVHQFTRECVTLLADNTLSGERWPRRWTRRCCNAAHWSRSQWTTEPSSPRRRWTTGRIRTACI